MVNYSCIGMAIFSCIVMRQKSVPRLLAWARRSARCSVFDPVKHSNLSSGKRKQADSQARSVNHMDQKDGGYGYPPYEENPRAAGQGSASRADIAMILPPTAAILRSNTTPTRPMIPPMAQGRRDMTSTVMPRSRASMPIRRIPMRRARSIRITHINIRKVPPMAPRRITTGNSRSRRIRSSRSTHIPKSPQTRMRSRLSRTRIVRARTPDDIPINRTTPTRRACR